MQGISQKDQSGKQITSKQIQQWFKNTNQTIYSQIYSNFAMYDKKDSYRNYYSHSKINDYKYYGSSNAYESPRDKSYLTGLDNIALKKKSKSDLHTGLSNSYFKPKLNNLTITTMKQKSINLRTERSESYHDEKESKQIGKKLENYKIKKLEQKIKESGYTERSTNKLCYPQSPSARLISSVSESKKNLSARKPSDNHQSLTESKNGQDLKQSHKMYDNHKKPINLEIDTQKLTEFFQNKKFQSQVPQTTKSILQYNQYNKIIKKNQMALRPFQESKLVFKKNKDHLQQQYHQYPHTGRDYRQEQQQNVQLREEKMFEQYHLKKDNYTPKMSKKSESLMSSTKSDRKTLKKEKLEPLSIKDFQIYKQLGKGQNGKIYSAFHIKTGMLVALKHFQQNKVIIDYLIDEMKIQLFSVHPNILAAFGYIIEKSSTIDTTGVYIEEEEKSKSRTFYNIYIIMEKGEFNLFSLIRKEKHLNEESTAIFTQQILQGLKYLHENMIIHRDLKPENIIIVDGVCKITDFGWSVIGSQERETFCGTLEYVSPQVAVGSKYDNKIDIWSVGVLIFEMLTGEAPYDTTKIMQNPKDEFRKRILSRLPLTVSFECKDLLSKLLRINPKERISIDEALNHKWIREALTRKTMKKNAMAIRDEFQRILSC